MEKPAVIAELESALNIALHPAPKHGHDPIRNVMSCRKDPDREGGWLTQYALHSDGSLAGLNLAGFGLHHEDWQNITWRFDLTRLEALNLRGNALEAMTDLTKMPNLRYLDLCNNQLREFVLPAGIEGLEHLWLAGNDFNDPVLLARAKQGRRALLEHLRGLTQDGMEELYEARMLIIGEPRAGKTSLRKKLQDETNPLPTLSTKGIDVDIDVESNAFPYTTSSGKQVTFHYQVWDFGGQRQYHPTHQLFFVRSTLYILVTNTDYDHKNEGDVEFWLETVNKLGEGSPVLRVENKQSDRDDSTDWKDINRRFGTMIKGVFPVNLDRVNPEVQDRYKIEDAKQFRLLKDSIVLQLKSLEHIGSKVTPTWRRIREAIAKRAKETPCISLDEYRRTCNEFGYFDPAQQLDLSKTFHTLGIFLHYQHNAVLRNTVILQNEWAIDAVFAILDSSLLREKRGKFDRKDLPKIWEDKKYEGKQEDLLQLLQEFQLCYPLKQQEYVAPQCLEKTPPTKFGDWDETENVRVDVSYDFLPRAVITRLIVNMHEHIAQNREWAWQHGAVLDGEALKCKGTQAYLQEKYKKDEKPKIALRLRGTYSEDLFREIQTKLTDIHGDFPNLEVEYVIYCNCKDCKESDNPTPFNYFKELLRYRRELKLEEIECRTKAQKVKISDVLSGIISPSQAKEDQNRAATHFTNNITVNPTFVMPEISPNSTPEKSNNSIYGGLIAFVVILPTIALCVDMMKSPYLAVLVVVTTILIMMLLLVYAGTQSKTFSEDAFVKISERILSKIPGLGSLVTLIKGE